MEAAVVFGLERMVGFWFPVLGGGAIDGGFGVAQWPTKMVEGEGKGEEGDSATGQRSGRKRGRREREGWQRRVGFPAMGEESEGEEVERE
ncbi:hypothetical protein HAX54_010524 [Datura stramonium]|uniref:Uncharacterized protein n=1 Tax=Datura stramonium TaxID=4076 RepID=A0ABS8WW10_DATST|nr:hypothetical protein [Datura stramonium]